MINLEGKNVFHKLWYGLRRYILVLKVFDLFLQGSLLVITLLETNALLLLQRDAGTGYLPSQLEEWVLMGASSVVFVLGILICWFGKNNRNIALSICLGVTALTSLLVLVFPFKGLASPAVGLYLNKLCGGDTISSYSEALAQEGISDVSNFRVALLILTVAMCLLTTISIWAHGLSYLDDHDPQNGPYFYGILISIQLSLGLSAKNWLKPTAFRDDWWEAHSSISMLVLMFAILFTLFPKRMPQWRPIDVTNDQGLLSSILRMIRNKVLCAQILALSLLNTGLLSFIKHDDAYVQARFHVEALWSDPQTSRGVSDIFRSLVVVFFTMIFRVRFSNRSDGVKANTAARVGGVVTIFVAIFFGVIAALNCPIGQIAGLAEGASWQQPQCSWECRCDSARYGFTPVCDVDTGISYFSPCSAGCNGYETLNGLVLFKNCTCGTNHVVRGSCTLPSCRLAYSAYQVLYTVTIAVSAAAFIMQGMVILRAVQRWDKSVAQGLAFSAMLLVAHVPGHLLYKIISHLTCAYAGNDRTACIFHRPSLWWAAVTSAILSLISAFISILSSRMHVVNHNHLDGNAIYDAFGVPTTTL